MSVYWNYENLRRQDKSVGVLCLGDSWVWYPWGNLANGLIPLIRNGEGVLVLGKNGMRVKDLTSKLTLDVSDVVRTFKGMRAVVISLGGNDLAGGNIHKFLRPDCSRAISCSECIEWAALDKQVQSIGAAISGFIDGIRLSRASIYDLPIFVHGYDYPHASRRGWFGQDRTLSGPMDACRVPEALRSGVLKLVVDALNAHLQIIKDKPKHNFHYVDLRGVLFSHEWLDELHPTGRGFSALGLQLQSHMRGALL